MDELRKVRSEYLREMQSLAKYLAAANIAAFFFYGWPVTDSGIVIHAYHFWSFSAALVSGVAVIWYSANMHENFMTILSGQKKEKSITPSVKIERFKFSLLIYGMTCLFWSAIVYATEVVQGLNV